MNNDIDVSKCKYYRPFYFIEDTGIEHYCDDSYLTCTGSDDCYYQKLQIEIQQKEKYKNCLEKIKARVIQENADELLEWIVETIESVGA
jgi:hypothetical protein